MSKILGLDIQTPSCFCVKDMGFGHADKLMNSPLASQESDCSAHLDKQSKQHHVNSKSRFNVHGPKETTVVFRNNTTACFALLSKDAFCARALVGLARLSVKGWREVNWLCLLVKTRSVGKQMDTGSNPLPLTIFFKSCGSLTLVHWSCPPQLNKQWICLHCWHHAAESLVRSSTSFHNLLPVVGTTDAEIKSPLLRTQSYGGFSLLSIEKIRI